MGGKWRSGTVLELQAAGVLLVEDGNHGEYRPRPDEFVDRGVAFIRAADMDNGRVLFDAASKINEVARRRITKGVGARGDVLLSHKGTVGKVALVPDDAPDFVCSPQTTFWRVLDEDVLDRRYLHAFLRSPEFHRQLAARAGETDMAPYVSLTSQRGLTVSFPPLPEQRAIARILSALDDKIELNRKMNATLEAMARALFKSWFVDFDPVRAKAEGRAPSGMDAETAKLFPSEFVESELGPIPKGWRLGNVSDVAENRRDTVHPKDVRPGSAYLGLEHLPRGRVFLEKIATPDNLESLKAQFSSGEVLFGKLRPYFKKVAIAPCSGICSTDILVLSPKSQSSAFVALLAASDPFIEHAVALSDGTRMPRTSWEQLTRFDVVVPPDIVLQAFEQQCVVVFCQAEAIRQQSATLARIRDELLPRLLSGQLSVAYAEREAEAVQ